MSVAADAHSTVATHIFPTCTNSEYTPIVGPMLFFPVLIISILLMTFLNIRSILFVPKEVPESVAYDGQSHKVHVLCTICVYPIPGLSSAIRKPGRLLCVKKVGR